jgi:hypothetical protein
VCESEYCGLRILVLACGNVKTDEAEEWMTSFVVLGLMVDLVSSYIL